VIKGHIYYYLVEGHRDSKKVIRSVRMRGVQRRELERDCRGELIFPNPVPADPEELLVLMDDAANHAGIAQGTGAPTFDHGMRIFNQLKAHYDLRIAYELAAAHLVSSRQPTI
jgi:hypothetical protein